MEKQNNNTIIVSVDGFFYNHYYHIYDSKISDLLALRRRQLKYYCSYVYCFLFYFFFIS